MHQGSSKQLYCDWAISSIWPSYSVWKDSYSETQFSYLDWHTGVNSILSSLLCNLTLTTFLYSRRWDLALLFSLGATFEKSPSMRKLAKLTNSSLRSESHPLTSNSLFTGGERKDKYFYSLEAAEEQLLLLGGVMQMGVLLSGLTPPIHYKHKEDVASSSQAVGYWLERLIKVITVAAFFLFRFEDHSASTSFNCNSWYILGICSKGNRTANQFLS